MLKAQKQAQRAQACAADGNDDGVARAIRPTTRPGATFLTTVGRSARRSGTVGRAPAFRPSCRPRCSAPAAPSNRINIGAIGTGRISRGHDLPGIWQHDTARIMAVCDLDSRRVQDAKTLVNGHYTKTTGKPYDGVTGYADYRELLANKDIDAVVISTPDHWHALIAIDAVDAGKDVYLQKPASLTIAEGRALSNAVHRTGRIFQIGSQQRSSPQFRYAAELVRNGRIGQLKTVQVGLPGDPVRRRRARDAGAEEPQLRHVARLDAGRVLHREARAPAERLRPAGLAALRAVRRRHDHRLGRAPHRQRALGHGRRVHRARSRSGARPSSRRTASGTCTARSRPKRSTPTA